MASPTSYAFVLFDYDGCTEILDIKKLNGTQQVIQGARCTTQWKRQQHQVEVLAVSDNKKTLRAFEKEWSTSGRAVDLDQLIEMRGPNSFGGYLTGSSNQENNQNHESNSSPVHVEISEVNIPVTETQRQPSPTPMRTGSKQGSKARKITVHHEGSGDYTQREPCYMEGLDPDQVDLINQRLQDHTTGKAAVFVQTEPVVVISPEDEVQIPNTQKSSTTYVSKSTQTDCSERLPDSASNTEEILRLVREISESIKQQNNFQMHNFNSFSDLSSLLDINTPNQQVNIESVTPVIHMNEDNNSMTMVPPPVEPVVMEDIVVPTATTENLVPVHLIPTEISSHTDMLNVTTEVRVSSELQRETRMNACSTGNFAWQLTKKLYSKEEMQGRNYYGKKGKDALSPRRRTAIERCVMDTYGPQKDNIRKSVDCINTGLRNMNVRRSAFTAIENL